MKNVINKLIKNPRSTRSIGILGILAILLSNISCASSTIYNANEYSNVAPAYNVNPANLNSTWELENTLQYPKSPFTLFTGTVLPAVLITNVNSDTNGLVEGQISRNIYDSVTGKYLLIPSGSKIIGSYGASPEMGTQRLVVNWHRIIFANGTNLDLSVMPGTTADGGAGLKDKINNHYVRLYGNALLLTVITAGIALSTKQNEDTTGNKKTSASDALTDALGQQLGTVSLRSINKNMNVSPTLQIRPGYRFNVIVTKDIIFNSPYK